MSDGTLGKQYTSTIYPEKTGIQANGIQVLIGTYNQQLISLKRPSTIRINRSAESGTTSRIWYSHINNTSERMDCVIYNGLFGINKNS